MRLMNLLKYQMTQNNEHCSSVCAAQMGGVFICLLSLQNAVSLQAERTIPSQIRDRITP